MNKEKVLNSRETSLYNSRLFLYDECVKKNKYGSSSGQGVIPDRR